LRLGLIARADSRGLGVQTKAVYDNLQPHKTLVIDCPSAKPLPLRRDWYPDATWIHGLPTHSDFQRWLQGLDVVYTAETGYGTALWDEAERAGVKTVLAANYEFLDKRDRPTLWAMPSMWHYEDVPFANKAYLPVPIDTGSFPERRYATEQTAIRFLHVTGRPAIHDRNGLEDLLTALQWVTSEITVTLRCQMPGHVEGLIPRYDIPPNVKVVVESQDLQDNTELYAGQDVLVMPRRFGGLCLPVNEALGAGMPVIMPDLSPNNDWLPQEWLVPASWKSDFYAKQRVDVYQANPHDLAALMDRFATDQGFYSESRCSARELAEQRSWAALRPLYIKTFEEL